MLQNVLTDYYKHHNFSSNTPQGDIFATTLAAKSIGPCRKFCKWEQS